MGHHGVGRRVLHLLRGMVDLYVSGVRAGARCVLLQSDRRWTTRYHRPENAHVNPPPLSVDGLAIEFETRSVIVRTLDDVTFSIQKGEILGIVGESGSGKSVLSYALMGLLDQAGGAPRGKILFEGSE